jgi:hypothetical protein
MLKHFPGAVPVRAEAANQAPRPVQ